MENAQYARDAIRAAFWEIFEEELEKSDKWMEDPSMQTIIRCFLKLRRADLFVEDEIKNTRLRKFI